MSSRNLSQKLIADHLVSGSPDPGSPIAIRIDQTLTQDATGTLVMLELEAAGLDRTRTECSVQYVDHNLIQADFRNADDHRFLLSAARRFGLWYSPPGNGVSHPVHQNHFGRPGASLLGSDSHSCAAGSMGMLAIGAGGSAVAAAICGEPFYLRMPGILGVRLEGRLPDWVSAKDVILEMLRRHGVRGGVGRIIEYHGPGVAELSAMDRHVIANMGAELGATTSVFPSDHETRRFMVRRGREDQWRELAADPGAAYDQTETIILDELEPLMALPTSPGNVVPVREHAGEAVGQAYIGSSANPGYRDYAVAAAIVAGKRTAADVSFDINPSSRAVLQDLIAEGHMAHLVAAGARLHQAGCNGCIGMGQAPDSARLSLRTVPRNFPGRSGTQDDRVCLVSPETAAASALAGVVTDPRDLEMPCPRIAEPETPLEAMHVVAPPEDGTAIELVKGPNIASIPELPPIDGELRLPVLLKAGDDVSTDEILPAGAEVLPYRSNIPAISGFTFRDLDGGYVERAQERDRGDHAIVAGANYGQGSSREHAALAPRYLGLRLVAAVSFARIHRENLIGFGVLPVTFADPKDRERIDQGDELVLPELPDSLADTTLTLTNTSQDKAIPVKVDFSPREEEAFRAGGLINVLARRTNAHRTG